MTHRYAEMLGWLQAGQQILGKWRGGAEGHFPVSFNFREVAYAVDGAEGWEFRLKPRTVKIGNREVEAPVMEPEAGQALWYWDNYHDGPCNGKPSKDEASNGEWFASSEAARAAYAAYTALLRGEA